VKRGIIDTLKRGGENALANWQLSLIRFIEIFAFCALAVLGIIIALVPLLVSLGIRLTEIHTPDDMESAMRTLLQEWPAFVWFFAGMFLLFVVFVLVHSYVEAGCARLFVDADRAAGPATTGPKGRYRVFSVSRWFAGAREGGWRVFWIYNLAWTVAALILLIPLIPVAALMFVFRGNPAVSAGVGCLGILVVLLFGIVLGLITGMWTNRAIANWAAERSTARHALSTGWRAVKTDFGRHLLITLAIIVVALAGSSVFSSFSMFGSFGTSIHGRDIYNFMTAPIRMFGTILSWAFSSLIGSWYLASYSALSVESGKGS
jgi:hypothetical protein